MKRITIKKGGLWYFTTRFRRDGEDFLIKNVIDGDTIKHYGFGYVLNVVYKGHNEVIGAYETIYPN